MTTEHLAFLGTEATFVEDLTGPALDTRRWVGHYLPHWTTPERSRARYDLTAAGPRLRSDADQPDWRPEDAPLRVSNLQTATFAGPLGLQDPGRTTSIGVGARHLPAADQGRSRCITRWSHLARWLQCRGRRRCTDPSAVLPAG